MAGLRFRLRRLAATVLFGGGRLDGVRLDGLVVRRRFVVLDGLGAETLPEGGPGHAHDDAGRDLEGDRRVLEGGDGAEDAGGRHHLITHPNRGDQRLVLAGAPLLRPDHEHVENDEEEEDR